MKIGMISESPTITTGFGSTCRHISLGLSQAGYEVVCFGINAFGETFDRNKYPYKIWAVGIQNLIESMSEFLAYERPDVLFLNFDVVGLERWYQIIKALEWSKPIVSHFVADCLPINREYLDVLEKLQGKITPTKIVSSHLASQGIKDVFVAPHGVDKTIFRPLPNRDILRNNAGLNNKFVVGVFGRNCERKQQPRVLQAISLLKENERIENLIAYLHCQEIDNASLGGWDLREISHHLKIADTVIFTGDSFTQLKGIPYTGKDNNKDYKKNFFQYDYVERMNCCDLIINPAFCGGFELVIIEAQACGIPIAITNDKSIMQEVAGDGAYLLDTIDEGYWKLGGKQFFVSAKTISNAIVEISQNAQIKEKLISNGFANAQKYEWAHLMDGSVKMLKNIL